MEINLPEIEPFGEDSVISLNETGKLLALSGEMDQAEESFCKAVEINPTYLESYQNLGTIQAAQSKICDAIETYKKLIKLESGKAEHFTNLGILYFLDQSFGSSEASFEKALVLDGSYPDALFNFGKLLFNLDRYDEAMVKIEAFLEKDTSNTEAMTILGICYQKNNSEDMARSVWEKALEINPDLKEVRVRLDEISGLSDLGKKLMEISDTF
ncbi:MAG: hypothetical protein GY941_05545 [Planctomycetes bacterium]|nr:hypothetical protein [Planctomycetota bacterium]